MSFWMEYNAAMANCRFMKTANIIAGVLSKQVWTENYLKIPSKVAWILCMPLSFEKALDEAIIYGMDQMRMILELPVVDEKTGKVNTSLASLKNKIVSQLYDRKYGAAVQRSVNVSIGSAQAGEVQEQIENLSMTDIRRKLVQLERKESGMDKNTAPVDRYS
jgi:hypothetical protein